MVPGTLAFRRNQGTTTFQMSVYIKEPSLLTLTLTSIIIYNSTKWTHSSTASVHGSPFGCMWSTLIYYQYYVMQLCISISSTSSSWQIPLFHTNSKVTLSSIRLSSDTDRLLPLRHKIRPVFVPPSVFFLSFSFSSDVFGDECPWHMLNNYTLDGNGNESSRSYPIPMNDGLQSA